MGKQTLDSKEYAGGHFVAEEKKEIVIIDDKTIKEKIYVIREQRMKPFIFVEHHRRMQEIKYQVLPR